MNDNDNLIPLREQAKMRHLATSTPAIKPESQPAAITTGDGATVANEAVSPADAEEPRLEKSEAKKPALTKMNIGILVTLDMTRGDLFQDSDAELKAALTKFEVPNSTESHNLYNPFKAVTAKTKAKDPEAARGLIRNALTSVFNIAAEVEGQNIMLVGAKADVVSLLRQTALLLQTRVENALGIHPDAVIASLTTTDDKTGNETPVPVLFKDVVRVNAWANITGGGLDLTKESEGGLTNTIFVNLTVNAGSLYSAAELDKGIFQITNYLTNQAQRYEEQNGYDPLLLAGVALRASSVGEEVFYDLIGAMNQNEAWDLFDRRELLNLAKTGAADWMPVTKQAVETALLPAEADLFYLAMLPAEAEGDATTSE